jgi:hypothetical protein
MRILRNIYLCLMVASCAQLTPANTNELVLDAPPSIGKNSFTGRIFLGGFSGMDFIETKDGSTYIYSITDRGPNTSSYDFDKDGVKDRGFLLPRFSPEIVKLKLTGSKVEIEKRIPLKLNKKRKVLGLPNQNKKTTPDNFDESPFDSRGKRLSFSRSGVDPEGIVLDKNGHFWIVEEYGPSILKVSQSGRVLKRFIPNVGKSKRYGEKKLPYVFGQRKLNRGFEGVTIIKNKLYAVLQSPFPYGKWKEEGIGHILEFDIEKEEVSGHYLYFFEKKGRKIGALAKTAKGDLLILEQNGKLGSNSFKKIYKLEERKWVKGQRLAKYRKFLKEYDFRSSKSDQKYILKFLEKALRKISNTDFDMHVLEEGNGVHELRREMRWFLIETKVLNGAIHFKKDSSICPINEYQNLPMQPIANSKYATINKSPLEKRSCLISQCLFLALVEKVGQYGDLKDEIESDLHLQDVLTDETPSQYIDELESLYDELKSSQVLDVLADQLQSCR